MVLAIVNAIFAIAYGILNNSGFQRGLNPWPPEFDAKL